MFSSTAHYARLLQLVHNFPLFLVCVASFLAWDTGVRLSRRERCSASNPWSAGFQHHIDTNCGQICVHTSDDIRDDFFRSQFAHRWVDVFDFLFDSDTSGATFQTCLVAAIGESVVDSLSAVSSFTVCPLLFAQQCLFLSTSSSFWETNNGLCLQESCRHWLRIILWPSCISLFRFLWAAAGIVAICRWLVWQIRSLCRSIHGAFHVDSRKNRIEYLKQLTKMHRFVPIVAAVADSVWILACRRDTCDKFSVHAFKVGSQQFESSMPGLQSSGQQHTDDEAICSSPTRQISPLKQGLRLARFNVDSQAVKYVQLLAASVAADPDTTLRQQRNEERWRWWRNLVGYVVISGVVHLILNRNWQKIANTYQRQVPRKLNQLFADRVINNKHIRYGWNRHPPVIVLGCRVTVVCTVVRLRHIWERGRERGT